jgi:hypothetical protein
MMPRMRVAGPARQALARLGDGVVDFGLDISFLGLVVSFLFFLFLHTALFGCGFLSYDIYPKQDLF